jgi:TatD DNase family protein
MRFINLHTHFIQTDGSLFVLNNRYRYSQKIETVTPFSIGIHPWDIELLSPFSLEDFEKIIIHPNCLAIGECGLDKLISTSLEIQKQLFEKQLQLAVKYHKPVIIHCVKAFDELIEICNPYITKIPMIVHGFNKSEKLAKQLTDKGFHLSLHHHVLLKSGFEIQSLPLDKLFFETDNDAHLLIQVVYKAFALKLNIELDVLKEKINRNFELLFYDTISR